MRNFIAELPDGTSKQIGSDYGAIMDMAYDEGIGEVLKLMGKGLWSLVWNEDGTENTNGIDKIKDSIEKSIKEILSNPKFFYNFTIVNFTLSNSV